MKKVLLVLVAIAIATPAMAAAITITGTGGVLTGSVGYSGATQLAKPDPGRPAAFALTLTADSGAKFLTVTPKISTVSGTLAAAKGYGIFPGTIVINTSGSVTSVGTPVEPTGLPGGPSALNSGRIVVALGALYSGDANKPAALDKLFDFTTDIACTVTVAVESTYRGGVVAEDATAMTVTLPAGIVITAPVTECVKSTAPFYNDWVTFGKPACWCYQRQCKGDINGTQQGAFWVFSQDLTALKNAYGKSNSQLTGNDICADLNHTPQGAFRVFSQDLSILKTNYGVAPLAACDGTNYNFWTN